MNLNLNNAQIIKWCEKVACEYAYQNKTLFPYGYNKNYDLVN